MYGSVDARRFATEGLCRFATSDYCVIAFIPLYVLWAVVWTTVRVTGFTQLHHGMD